MVRSMVLLSMHHTTSTMVRSMVLLSMLLTATAAAAAGVSEFDGVPVSAMVAADGTISVVPRGAHHASRVAAGIFGAAEAAWGLFNDSSYLQTGWAKLEIHTNPNMTDAVCASAAGVLEGKITAHRILESAMNGGLGPDMKPSPAMTAFSKVNDEWIASMQSLAKQSTVADKAYWHHVDLINLQMRGVWDGYTTAAKGSKGKLPALKWESILYMNLGDELGDFAGFKPGEGFVDKELPVFGDLKPFMEAGKCSALIKLLEDGSDIFISQETWTSFDSMLRIYKMYDFPFTMTGEPASGRVPAERVSFSSYPAVLNSGDDFYVTSAGLVVQETTIGNSNPDLATTFVSPLTLMEWLRNILANRLAKTGWDWPGLYALHNSGSYCNQNMILDYNQFEPGKPLKNGTFIISEQIPGYVINNDLSQLVQTEGYYGSYNTAYDPYLRQISGADAAEAKSGPWLGYWTTARAQIFKRDQVGIKGMDEMKGVMRQCNYKEDPLSHQQCLDGYIQDTSTYHPISTTENCIATRGDLNPTDGNWCIGSFAHRNHAATDAKISSFSTWSHSDTKVHATIVAGPTWGAQSGGDLPAFCWSKSDYNKTATSPTGSAQPEGHPDCFAFDWIEVF